MKVNDFLPGDFVKLYPYIDSTNNTDKYNGHPLDPIKQGQIPVKIFQICELLTTVSPLQPNIYKYFARNSMLETKVFLNDEEKKTQYIEPIPITGKFLEYIGFNHGGLYAYTFQLSKKEQLSLKINVLASTQTELLHTIKGKFSFYGEPIEDVYQHIPMKEIKYVHQLQHLPLYIKEYEDSKFPDADKIREYVENEMYLV